MSTYSSLSIALSGLRASQYAMDVTAHNIANAGTTGYHRQEPVFLAGNSSSSAGAMGAVGVPLLGTGVQIHSIRRMQTEYVDDQIRMTNQWLGNWSYKNESLKQVEAVLSEPGDLGLGSCLDKFWNSWSELSTSPESLPARESVVNCGIAVSERIRGLYRDFRSLQTTSDQCITDNAAQINRIAHEIGKLNQEIRRSMGAENQPNDLIDQRDSLIEQLSEITRVETSGNSGGDLIVSISGKSLVQGDVVTEINVTEGDNGWSQLVWSDDGSAVKASGGELAGQIDIRDNVIEGYVQSLNEVAQTIVEKVNELHITGTKMDGSPAGNFFAPDTDASNICVDSAIVDSPAGVATSTTGASGDGALAKSMCELQNGAFIDGQSIGTAYSGLVGRIGSDSREADSRIKTHMLSMQQLNAQRESVAGVSLDEEMANMVKFQQSYNAAARIFTVIDEMINTVVNQLGIVGR